LCGEEKEIYYPVKNIEIQIPVGKTLGNVSGKHTIQVCASFKDTTKFQNKQD
jgi:hypothetical protein